VDYNTRHLKEARQLRPSRTLVASHDARLAPVVYALLSALIILHAAGHKGGIAALRAYRKIFAALNLARNIIG
jgi:hypothetical protein